jgi:glycerol-3-phosphate dehydrogenase (NAD(P)+)
VLKNIYAVALGVADGLGLSENEKGWIAAVAIKEMEDVAAFLKADPAVVLGAGGVGDLIATGYSEYSRNHGIGAEIARTGICKLQGEGIASLPPLLRRIEEGKKVRSEEGREGEKEEREEERKTEGEKKEEKFPLLELVNAVGIKCKPAREAFDAFFNSRV